MRCKIPEHDLIQRLDHTVCMYNNIPYYIRAKGVDGGMIELYDFTSPSGPRVAKIDSQDPAFDVATPPLGYCQINSSTVVHLSRKPHRKFKQGLDQGALNIAYPPGAPQLGKFDFYSQSVYNTMIKKYPPIKGALASIDKQKKKLEAVGYIAVAISNDCCIAMQPSGVIKVYFRQEEVGYLSPKTVSDHSKPTVIVPSTRQGWLVSRYLNEFDWYVK